VKTADISIYISFIDALCLVFYTLLLSVKTASGLDCCSWRAISFHDVGAGKMFALEYFIYKFK
jgi:hypothetical protein